MRQMFGLVLILLAALPAYAGDEDIAKPPPIADFLVIPLRIHILTADDLPEVDCKLTDDDINRIVGKVNRVWSAAGVYWGLDSIVREPAAKQDQFRKARDLADKAAIPLNAFRALSPELSRLKDGLNVYYIHKFSVNGVYLGNRVAFVQEIASLRKVEGGIDEPLPRVTSHELGHALGLPHRQAQTNLLASGTTGTTLNASEVEKAREFAKKTPGSMTVAELTTTIDTEKDQTTIAVKKRWLAELNKPIEK